jgi:uncharacterized UBP type Zn finger protein
LCSSFALTKQHDASEFLSFLLSTIEENRSSLFKIKLESAIHCSVCKHFSSQHTTHLFFLPLSIISTSIQTLVNHFFGEEQIEKAACSHCLNTHFIKTFILTEAPEYFVFVLNRFCSVGQKKFDKVEFSNEIVIHVRNEIINYEIISIIIHIGSNSSSGHYLTCNKTDQGWRIINDECVYKFNVDFRIENIFDEREETPYIFFYKRKENGNKIMFQPEKKILDIIQSDNRVYEVEMSALF